LLGENARIVIRPSGTEDIVRIMVEANEKDLAKKSMNELIDVVKESCKG
jgi:phosphoglucosamine mutase